MQENTLNQHAFRPESMMMSYGYDPHLSEGAVKCPIFQTSTFVFRSAEEGKAYFELAYGLREKEKGEEMGLIYSRLNNPDLEILENRLTLWDGAETAAVFESGMSAISTVLLEFLSPGDLLVHSMPVYGGTDHFINHVLKKRFGIRVVGFAPNATEDEIAAAIEAAGGGVAVVYVETPANPTNAMIDLAMCRRLADRMATPGQQPLVVVDNTYMGPLWQHPLQHGADLVLYSATKYIGGHSDVIAGAVLGSKALMGRILALRTFLGSMAGPWTGWLLMRSLETLKVRMEAQSRNAVEVANWLNQHPKIEKVYYPGLLTEDDPQYEIYKRQCSAPGAMVSFELKGGEAEAFKMLNGLKMIKLAVSLGSTESLAQHPATMTHVDVDPAERLLYGITDKLVRLSVGVEYHGDIIWDLSQALDAV